jgi:hypothetical protein
MKSEVEETRQACPVHGAVAFGKDAYCYQCGRRTVAEPMPFQRCRCGKEYRDFVPAFCGKCGNPLRRSLTDTAAGMPWLFWLALLAGLLTALVLSIWRNP